MDGMVAYKPFRRKIDMRQIKFRGLRKDGGGWVYGDLVHTVSVSDGVSKNHTLIGEDLDLIEVHSDTVGQFTGLKDKNGKEIYEGDIVNLLADSISEKLGKAYGSWDTECDFIKDSFKLTCIDKKHLVWRFTDLDFNGSPFIREVIGNIHEKK